MGKGKRGIMNNYKNIYVFAIIVIFFVFSFKTVDSVAKVKGKCVNCHTMHNSQDGNLDPNGPPIAGLLNNDCIGCHSNDQESTYYDLDQYDPNDSLVPVVNYTGTDEPDNYLAGGNFWWVKEANKDKGADDSKGHNVFPNEGDDKLDRAPGGITCLTDSCHSNFHLEYESKAKPGLDGRQGCTGCHMLDDFIQPSGFHHADDGGRLDVIDDKPWYRFLKGHDPKHGVSGIEDPSWQAIDESDSENHNEYLGSEEVGGNTSEEWSLTLAHTVTAFCSGCHGKFHIQQKGDPNLPWIRHPSDWRLPNSGEYEAYQIYDPEVPVARTASYLSSCSGAQGATNRSKVNPGEDMVMCLSCHRPHGSPFSDILRWDYADMKVGSGKTNGCFVCHTKKN